MSKAYWSILLHTFFVLIILFVPFPYFLFDGQQFLAKYIFLPITKFLASISGNKISSVIISSDSAAMYWLYAILFFISLICCLLLTQIRNWRKYQARYLQISRWVLQAFLIFHLLKYGTDKIFLNQFYTPEPNILFTPIGKLDKDILYWSLMGSAPAYSIFLGLAEVGAAMLLLFSRTRRFGLLLSIGILVNVVAVNFFFDISVKLFSMTLLAIASLLYFWRENPVVNPMSKLHPAIRIATTVFITLLFVVEIIYPLRESMNRQEPIFSGAYEVQQSDTSNALRFKKFFIHKDGYLIFQDKQDNFFDYRLFIDTAQQVFSITEYNKKETLLKYKWNSRDSILSFLFPSDVKGQEIFGKKLRTNSLPALRNTFNWTAE